MAKSIPLKRGPTSVSPAITDVRQIPETDNLDAAGIEDATGLLISRQGGVPHAGPVVGGQPLDSTLQRTTDPKIPAGSPRGVPLFQDSRTATVDVLTQQEGLWCVGTVPTGTEYSPELLSSNYQTRATGSYAGGNVPAVDAIVTGTGWTARVESITGGASGTFVLSVYTGTTIDEASLTHTGGTLTGCTVQAGRLTNYAVTGTSASTGLRAPRGSGGGGFYNVIGAGPDVANGSRFPLLPVYYNRGFRFPKGAFDEGAKVEIEIAGVIANTVAQSSSPFVAFALAVGHNIFELTNLAGTNFDKVTRFLTPTIPTDASLTEHPFTFKIEGYASRKLDRTPGQLFTGTFKTQSNWWGGSGEWVNAVQRGSDTVVAPTTFLAYDTIDGEDATNKRDLKYASLWMAVGPAEIATGEMYVNVHTFQVRLIRGTR